jgi:hypothetical protein
MSTFGNISATDDCSDGDDGSEGNKNYNDKAAD